MYLYVHNGPFIFPSENKVLSRQRHNKKVLVMLIINKNSPCGKFIELNAFRNYPHYLYYSFIISVRWLSYEIGKKKGFSPVKNWRNIVIFMRILVKFLTWISQRSLCVINPARSQQLFIVLVPSKWDPNRSQRGSYSHTKCLKSPAKLVFSSPFYKNRYYAITVKFETFSQS